MAIELSILIPALFERIHESNMLTTELLRQIGDRNVELLLLTDNRKRSTGLKRQALLDMSKGRYITHLDDDDWISPTYIEDILAAIAKPEVDVIVFNQTCTWNNENTFTVRCGLEYINEGMHKDKEGGVWQDITRKPWHWNVWNARIAHQAKFPDGYIDDDWYWLKQTIALCSVQRRIDKTLHLYRYTSDKSASQQGEPTVTDLTI